MMPTRKPNLRTEYRLLQIQRVNDSVSLAQKFPDLKSLKVDLAYFNPDGITKTGGLKYSVNVVHAKSVFSFACRNGDCLAGSYDLSDALTEAVTHLRKSFEGEIRCSGTRERRNETGPCHNLLRFKLTIGYA